MGLPNKTADSLLSPFFRRQSTESVKGYFQTPFGIVYRRDLHQQSITRLGRRARRIAGTTLRFLVMIAPPLDHAGDQVARDIIGGL